MKRTTAFSCLVLFLSIAPVLSRAQASTPGPTFSVSASDYTMPSSGIGSNSYTVTSIDGFVGTIAASCISPNPPQGVSEPYCGNYGGPAIPPIQLAADGTGHGLFQITSKVPLPTHQSAAEKLILRGEHASLALAVFMLGFGVRRKRFPRSRSLLLLGAMLLGVSSISGCGNGAPTLTPGTYTYTITASLLVQNEPTTVQTTTFIVTVPAGVPILPAQPTVD